MTVVAQTTGYIGEGPLLTPDAEAQFLQKWWLGYHRLPAALAVTNTRFFRLAELDRRRIDEPVENSVGYLFGMGQDMGSKAMYLIDTNGTILHSGGMNQWGERELRGMLDVVMNRGR